MTAKIKTYLELSELKTFEERFKYLQMNSFVGDVTFGYERYLNQKFYTSKEWRKVRRDVIIRDNGCDLGIPGRELVGKVYIHHINPITPKDIANQNLSALLDPDNLITVSFETHQAIHYGDISQTTNLPAERKPGDTCPWKG